MEFLCDFNSHRSKLVIHIRAGMYIPIESGLGVDLLLVLCWEDVDSVPSSTLAEQLSSSSCFIHLCMRTTVMSVQNQKLTYLTDTGF